MAQERPVALVVSASSDIGAALCRRWIAAEWDVLGTFRTDSSDVQALAKQGVRLVHCDLSQATSIRSACSDMLAQRASWDVLVLCPGNLEPIGLFPDVDFNEWSQSVHVNLLAQLQMVHNLLPARNRSAAQGACVLFFAGGGSNSAPVRFSAYTLAKVALIKMTELLDAEVPDTRFAILGPGWVRTKIHNQTLHAGAAAGAAYGQTQQKIAQNDMTPMERVLDCCDWLVRQPREVIGGRNFSVVHDPWDSPQLAQRLRTDSDWYKLRRYGSSNPIAKVGPR